MIANTFNSGNFNQWDHFVNTILPAKNMILRQEIIPTIDSTLTTMLGPSATIEKTSIDVFEICDRQSLKAIKFTLIYTVKDFKVPEAPRAAVEKDTQVITNALLREDCNLITMNIDTNSGKVTIEYEIPLTEE